jgi:hypothetical protein
VGTGLEQSAHDRCGLDQVFEVVEHEEPLPGPQRGRQRHQRWLGIGPANAKRLGDGRGDHIGLADGRKLDDVDAIRERIHDIGGDPERQPGLANPAGSGQGHQPDGRVADEGGDAGDLPLASHE